MICECLKLNEVSNGISNSLYARIQEAGSKNTKTDQYDLVISVSEMGIILKLTDVLVTDYSGVWVDFLLTNRPIISFCYDMDSYLDDRGFYYDYEAIFPGRINTNFNTFLEDLNQNLKDRIPRDRLIKKSDIRQRFHKYSDGQSTHRVTEEVIRLLKK